MARPVVVDTDVGDDIDDMFALAYVLASDQFDVKLVITAFGDLERHLQRAGLVRKLLQVRRQSRQALLQAFLPSTI